MKAPTSTPSRRPRHRPVLPMSERLETRTLLSGWSTVDHLSAPNGSYVNAMAADPFGNVYAAGDVIDANIDGSNTVHGTVREKTPGSASWTTIEDLPDVSFAALAVDRAGDLFVGGPHQTPIGQDKSLIFERRAGQSDFTLVPSSTDDSVVGLTADLAGNVYAVGGGRGGAAWVVQKLAAGQSSFAVVDQFGRFGFASAAGSIPAGPAAGLYVVGSIYNENGPQWTVRKSTDGGATWSTVDTVANTAAQESDAYAVGGDAIGNVYVVGGAPTSGDVFQWVTRKSADGGKTWSTVDDFQLGGANAIGSGSAVGMDAQGDIFVAGQSGQTLGGPISGHAVVRENVGGGWSTDDDYPPTRGADSFYGSFVVDAFGNLYAGGRDGTINWLIRSKSGPAAQVTLDFNYLLTLAQHYDGPAAFTTGDLDRDGQVNFADLLLLAQNYGRTVSPADLIPPAPQSAAAAAAIVASANITPAIDSTTDWLHRTHRRR